MLSFRLVFYSIVLFGLISYSWASSQASTGFYYPTGNDNFGTEGIWLASGCGVDDGYFNGYYHIGRDMDSNLNSPVFPVSDGEVIYISYNGWGTGNVAVFIKHRLSNGSEFLALYGHIQTGVAIGDMVYAGKEFATIGYWGYGNHLHFGVINGTSIPPAPFGKMLCANWPETNTFIDPVNWIESQTPYVNVAHYSDGWHDDGTSQAILDRFIQSGIEGHPLGSPWDNDGGLYVHDWYDVTLQDFKGDNTNYYHGYTAIILNPIGSAAHLLKEGFWDFYMRHEGYRNLGAPTTEEYWSGNLVKQDFEYGRLVWYGGNDVGMENLDGSPKPMQSMIFTPDPATAETWHHGEKLGTGNFSVALYEGFEYEFQVKENGYEVGTQNISVPSTSSEINPDLSPGNGASPDNFPLTLQAENMDGLGTPTANGMNLTSQNWFIGQQPWVYFSGPGWVEAEVKVKANNQVNGQWPYLEYEAFGYIAPQEVNSTDWIKLYYLFEVLQAVDAWTAVKLADQTKNVPGHSVEVDYVILRYLPGIVVPPIANADQADVPIETPQEIDVIDNDIDDNSLDPSTVEIVEQPASGTVGVDSQTGRVTYIPSSGYIGSDEFRYSIRDNEGAISKSSTVSLGVKRIVVTQPNGGESYGYRDYVDVTWQQDSSIAAVRVEYSTNGGQRWTLAGFVYGGTTKNFRNMQMSEKTECLVRVKNKNDYSEYDDSNSYFTLEGYNSRFSKGVIPGDGVVVDKLPENYSLYQNHPNPFNPTTVIQFALPEAGQVKIVVYDLLGQEIRELVNGYQAAGYGQVVWDSKDNYGNPVASGVYVYRMVADKFIQTNKLILLR